MEMTSCYNDVDAGDMLAAVDYYSAGAGTGAGGDLFDMVWPGRRRREEDNTSGCLPLSPPPPPELAVDDQLPAGGDGGGGEPVGYFLTERVYTVYESGAGAGAGGDLFDMVWPGRRRREEDNTSGCLPLSPPLPPELAVDDQLPAGGDGGGGGGEPVVVAVAEDDDSGERWTEDQVPTDEGICVMESNNQASTLDKTIRYMKSLQQHAQAMSVGCSMMAAAAAGVTYPFLPPPPSPYSAINDDACGAGAIDDVSGSSCRVK
uniref:BHLH domain-containing protein n=1 Tax=Oryza barthii TaxID=65489 RepID=A0A0D3HWF3_9ORYZ